MCSYAVIVGSLLYVSVPNPNKYKPTNKKCPRNIQDSPRILGHTHTQNKPKKMEVVA